MNALVFSEKLESQMKLHHQTIGNVCLYTYNDVQLKFIMQRESPRITSFFKFNGKGVNFRNTIMPPFDRFSLSFLCSIMNVRKPSFNSLGSECSLVNIK